MKKILVFVLGLAFMSVTFLNSNNLRAQEDAGSGFKISPIRAELEIERDRTATQAIDIENVTNSVLTAVAVIDDFTTGDDEIGTPKLLIGNDAVENYPYSIKPFVVPLEEIELAPGQKRTINVTLSIPRTTAPGAYFGVVRFVNKDIATDSTVALSASVGTIFLIRVPGDTVEILQLEQLSASLTGNIRSIFWSPPDSITVRLKNEGNTFIAPFGRVTVTNWGGDVVASYELNSTIPPGNVLPQSVRKFVDEIDGVGKFGRYTVEASISYGTGGNIIDAKATFWVIPWLVIVIALSSVVAILFVGTKGVRAYNAMILRRAKGTRRNR